MTQGLSLAWNLPVTVNWLDRIARDLQDSASLALTFQTQTTVIPGLFTWDVEVELRSQALYQLSQLYDTSLKGISPVASKEKLEPDDSGEG